MATVKLLLYDYYQKKDSNKKPLYIRIIHNRKPKYIALGISVDPEKDWDSERLRVKTTFPNATRVNNFIVKKLVQAEKLALDLEEKNLSLSSQRIRKEIFGEPSGSFIDFAFTEIKRLEQKGKIGTANRYRTVINKLNRFLKNKPFTFENFNVAFLHDYEAHLKHIGNHTNTIHANLKALKTILYLAIREDRLPQEKNPFFKFKLKKAPTKKERLTMEEINRIAELKIDENILLYHTRNAFLFSFYCAGIRVGDLIQLKWKNVEKILDYQMGKTKQHRRLKLVRQAQKILDIYRSDENKPTDFIFPFFSNQIDYSDENFLHCQLGSKSSMINRNLKTLAKRAEISKNISSHLARHSFADIARKKGIAIYDISKALGHSSIRVTEKYLTDFDDSTLDDAMDKIFE